MKVLTDYHHGDLYYSLHCLFEKRLDFELYSIIGYDWADQYFKIHKIENNDLIKEQFLMYEGGEHYGNKHNRTIDNIFYHWNWRHHYYRKCISLDTFKNMNFDIILPTYHHHYIPWKKLQEKYQPNAKTIIHVGNVDRKDNAEYVIRSVPFLGTCKSQVLVNQEIDHNIYKFVPVNFKTKKITSVTSRGVFENKFYEYKNQLDECEFKFYGIGNPDGVLSLHELAKEMQKSNIGWSLKSFGGLGHSNMGWMHSGRPIITNLSEHRKLGELATQLFEDGVTCIDIDARTTHENCKIIREWLDPEFTNKKSIECIKRFNELVNYENEAENLKKFLSNIF